jgi:hypothetical protein
MKAGKPYRHKRNEETDKSVFLLNEILPVMYKMSKNSWYLLYDYRTDIFR